MPGPWFCPRLDPDYLPFWSVHPGEVVEIQAYDDGGSEQGCVLLKVVDVAPSSKAGCEFAAQYVASSDAYYRHWMVEGGHPEVGLYHLCPGQVGSCKYKVGKKPMVHTDKVRMVYAEDVDAGRVPWLKKVALNVKELWPGCHAGGG
eukprot:4469852-Amphidinium_carterae.1